MATCNQLNNDRLKTCPFNRNHRVKASRFQAHITKCEKQMGISLAKCPFNSTHRMPDDQYQGHLLNCPDNRQFMRSTFTAKTEKVEQKTENTEVFLNRDFDDWDEEYMSSEMVEQQTRDHYILNKADKVTADWLFKKRLNDKTFVDSLYIQMMSKEERKIYQQMCVQQIKESIKAGKDVNLRTATSGHSSQKRQLEDEEHSQFKVPGVEMRAPAVVNPFHKQFGIGRGQIRKQKVHAFGRPSAHPIQ